jgi:hypothetical protein
MTRTLTTSVALAVLAVGAATPEPASTAGASRSCRVTLPNHVVPPDAGFTAAGFNYGTAYLRAHLYWPRGTLTAGIRPDGGAMAIVNPDGSIYAKLGWWRGTPGRLVVRGRRLDGRAPPLRADVPPSESYGDVGFIPTGLTFPTVGCWQVTGKVRNASLAFVVRVVKLRRRG